jgi:hypothetical protein
MPALQQTNDAKLLQPLRNKNLSNPFVVASRVVPATISCTLADAVPERGVGSG